jgi:hypothetical protein
VTAALKNLAARDPEDVDYPGLLLTIGADAVLTKDQDILQHGGVATWAFGDAIRMVGTHDRGRLALQIHFQTAQALTVALAIGFGAAKEIWEGLGKIMKQVPAEIWLGIGLGAGALLGFETPRRWVFDRLTRLKGRFGYHGAAFAAAAKKAWDVLFPVLEDLFRAMDEAEALSQSLPPRRRTFGRIPTALRERVLQSLSGRAKGMTLEEVVGAMVPSLVDCEIGTLRRQVYRVLSGDERIRRISRGRFAPARARRGRSSGGIAGGLPRA